MKFEKGMPDISMFSKLDKLVFAIMSLAIVIAVAWKIIDSQVDDENKKTVKSRSARQNEDSVQGTKWKRNTPFKIAVIQKWDMPAELKEISALSNIDEHRFACVQDEIGMIYVYNTAVNKIEKKIQFAEKGDFEGVAFTGSHFYALRADGQLYETPFAATEKIETREYKTPLTAKHNVEGLCYDKPNNRLLLAIKDEAPNLPGYKGIYAFDLQKKVLSNEPVYKIELEHTLFKQSKKSKIMPSAITIHPESKEIFITDGPASRLLILDQSGQPKHLVDLGKDFSQPEGITFDAKGNLFISNEGTSKPGNILQVRL